VALQGTVGGREIAAAFPAVSPQGRTVSLSKIDFRVISTTLTLCCLGGYSSFLAQLERYVSLWFILLAIAVSFIAGATASVVGFGIGSILTPVLALEYGVELAVAMVALPHLAGGVLRGWRLRRSINRSLVLRFGVLSFACGLLGALVFARIAPAVVARIMGALLLLTALAGITGWTRRWQPRGILIWIFGGLSGFFGGVVGNQGGLRAAALSTFGLEPVVLVATSTMIGVLTDMARTPVYLYRGRLKITEVWGVIVIAVVAVLAGTLLGERVLFGLSPDRYRVIISLAIGALGGWFLINPSGP
jgi:uncharacterized protein